jgi:hypothetical protein
VCIDYLTLFAQSKLSVVHTIGVVGIHAVTYTIAASVRKYSSLEKLSAFRYVMNDYTHVNSNDISHGKKRRQTCPDFGREPGVLDLQLLHKNQLVLFVRSVEHQVLTCPQPSRRKMRPKVDDPMYPLRSSRELRRRLSMMKLRRQADHFEVLRVLRGTVCTTRSMPSAYDLSDRLGYAFEKSHLNAEQ